jgi:MFS family permease
LPLPQLIVSSAIVAAGVGSVAGGWLADRAGRRCALLAADALFTAGSLAMAAAWDQYWLIAGERKPLGWSDMLAKGWLGRGRAMAPLLLICGRNREPALSPST